MKDQGYYERLISDSLDRELSTGESDELEKALRNDPSLVRFRDEIMRQAALIRSLPNIGCPSPLTRPQKVSSRHGILRWLWDTRVSIPLPIAAVLLFAILATGIFRVSSNRARPNQGTPDAAKGIEYVQVERFKPVSAVLVQRNNEGNPFFDKEEL